MADPDVEQFKLWPTNRDVEQYRLVVEAGSRSALETKHPPVIKRKKLQPRPRMVEAYLIFSEQISAWIDENRSHASDRMKALRRVFDRRMQLVSIGLGRDEDPQAIFETLNARGVPLLASDLLRNYVFQRAATPAEANRLYEKYWKRFEEPDDLADPEGERFWEKEERQGRLNRARLDLFVQHYLTMKRGVEVASGRLFPEYKQWVERELRVSLEDELVEFSRYATIFQTLLRPDPRTAEGKFARRLRILDNSTVYPFVLLVAGDGRIAPAERQQIYADLESFLVRRLVCGRTTRNYNRLFLQLLRDFARGEPTSAAFRTLLLAGNGETVDWPDDESFERAWREVDAYQELKPAKVEMLLRALSDAMTNDKAEHIVLDQKLSVEHVLPQTWEAHWPLGPDTDPEAAAAAREELVHDFGNLTLLTQPLNSSVSNGPASGKLRDIALKSVLPINTQFQGPTTWTEIDIRQRGAQTAAMARRVWARPTGSP